MSESTYADLKYFAYRFAYMKRHKATPKGSAPNRKTKITWGQWFESKYGEPIESYHQRVLARKQKLKNNP